MTMMRYEPWSILNQFSSELNRMFDRNLPAKADDTSVSACDWVPAVDIREEENRFLIHADIPGVDPKDIDIHMENGVLTISGQRQGESREEHEGYRRIERSRGTFLRRFTLPDTADADKITARSNNGVLEVIIPKHDKVQPRKISIEH